MINIFLKSVGFFKNYFFLKTWPTKPMEFWTLLNFILIYTKPNSILELGSGRSTFYLYEYAIGYEKKLNSIEHNYKFYRYIKKNLRSIFNNDCDFVTFAPIKKNW